MTQEEKELLLQNICARLAYGVQYKDAHGYKETIDIWSHELHTALNTILYDGKPSLYLRPMSSMTEEESKEFALLQTDFYVDGFLYPIAAINMVNWLNKHHFDYLGLIPMGLAIEAPEGMYKTKIE